MVAPVGRESSKDMRRPERKEIREMIAEQMVTPRKVLQSRIAVSAGKIIKLEMSIDPIIRIPRTMVTAVSRAISIV